VSYRFEEVFLPENAASGVGDGNVDDNLVEALNDQIEIGSMHSIGFPTGLYYFFRVCSWVLLCWGCVEESRVV